MYGSHRRGARHEMNVWPGWVDALSSLIMVIIFVLMIFVVAQFYLAQTLTGRDQRLAQLSQKITDLNTLLGTERQNGKALQATVTQLTGKLQGAETARDKVAAELAALRSERDALAARLAALSQQAEASRSEAGRVSRALEDANKVIAADREAIALKLSTIAGLEADLKTLRETRDKLEGEVAALTVLARSLETKAGDLTKQLDAAAAEQTKRSEALRLTEEQRLKLEALLAEAREHGQNLETQLATAQATAQAQSDASEKQRLKLGDELRLNEEQRQHLMAELATLRDRAKSLDSALAEQSERTTLAQKESAAREARLTDLTTVLESTRTALAGEQQQTSDSRKQIDTLTAEISALRQQMANLAATLEAEQKNGSQQQAQIVDLTDRLNVALVNKVEELARYRSEFFGRLRDAIGTRSDIRIVGDRFVFQSEVLFPTGSANLQEAGKGQLGQLARTLLDIAQTIPPDVNWILRVDGHTDQRRIATAQFPSNWELSTARAISVVKFLVDQGIPAERLAATGFGEFQPLDPSLSEEAFGRNRRIELKLDQR